MKKLRRRKEQKIIYLSKFKSLWVIYGCLLFRKKTFNINKHLQSESSTRKYILTVKIYGYLVKEMIFFQFFRIQPVWKINSLKTHIEFYILPKILSNGIIFGIKFCINVWIFQHSLVFQLWLSHFINITDIRWVRL